MCLCDGDGDYTAVSCKLKGNTKVRLISSRNISEAYEREILTDVLAIMNRPAALAVRTRYGIRRSHRQKLSDSEGVSL